MPRVTYTKQDKIDLVTFAKHSSVEYASWRFNIPRRTIKAWIDKNILPMTMTDMIIAKCDLEYHKEQLEFRVKELKHANEKLKENNTMLESVIKEIQCSAKKANQIIEETAV